MNTHFTSLKQPVYSNNIDFDEASNAWRENKKCLKSGKFTYVCGKLTKSGLRCQREPKVHAEYCFQHLS